MDHLKSQYPHNYVRRYTVAKSVRDRVRVRHGSWGKAADALFEKTRPEFSAKSFEAALNGKACREEVARLIMAEAS